MLPCLVRRDVDEDLCLVLQAPKGAGVNYPVAVALETIATGAFRLIMVAAPAEPRLGGVGRKLTVIGNRGLHGREPKASPLVRQPV